MALDATYLTRHVRREPTDPTTGPYLTGQNIVDTVADLVAAVNTELDTRDTAGAAQDMNIQRLAGHVTGSEALPVPAAAPSQDLQTLIADLTARLTEAEAAIIALQAG